MLEKLLDKKVTISKAKFVNAGAGPTDNSFGLVTAIDENFIELNNKEIVAIKYIIEIKVM